MAQTKAQELLAAACKAGGERDYGKAIEILTTLLSGEESQPEVLLYLGRSYHALGEAGKAIAVFRSYLREGGEASTGNFFLGRAYLGTGRLGEASSCLRKSLEANPDHAQAWALLGAAQLKLKRTKLAVSCLERATTLAPADERIFHGYLNALFARACRLLRQGDPGMARQMLSFVIKNGHDGAGPRLWLAKALRELGNNSEALAECERAMAFAPEDDSLRWLRAGLLLSSGRHEEALAEFDELRSLHPELPGLPQNAQAVANIRAALAFRNGEWKEAVTEALALLKANPDNPSLRAMAAESFRELGQLDKARNHWERAIASDPAEPDFHLGLALVHFELGEFADAQAQVARARRLGADEGESEYYEVLIESRKRGLKGEAAEPDQDLVARIQEQIKSRGAEPHLMFALGEELYRSGRPDLASGWFDKVLYLIPGHELSLLYRISVAESLGDGKALLSAYGAYLKAYPDNKTIRKEYVDALFGAASWAEAAKALELGIAYGLAMPRRLALAYRNAGRFADAALLYRDLLRENPESQEFLLALAFCLDKTGRADYALKLLESAPSAAKTGAGPWIIMGLLNARKGRTEAALDSYRKATELEPGNARAWQELGLLYRRQGLAEFAAASLEKARLLGAKPPESTALSIPLPRKPRTMPGEGQEALPGKAAKGKPGTGRAKKS